MQREVVATRLDVLRSALFLACGTEIDQIAQSSALVDLVAVCAQRGSTQEWDQMGPFLESELFIAVAQSHWQNHPCVCRIGNSCGLQCNALRHCAPGRAWKTIENVTAKDVASCARTRV